MMFFYIHNRHLLIMMSVM